MPPLVHVRLSSCQREDASAQLSKAEAGWGERLRVWQAAQVQRATEREQLSIPRHCGQEGGGLHACPALQPDDRKQRSDTRGKNSNAHTYSIQSCTANTFYKFCFYLFDNLSAVNVFSLRKVYA